MNTGGDKEGGWCECFMKPNKDIVRQHIQFTKYNLNCSGSYT